MEQRVHSKPMGSICNSVADAWRLVASAHALRNRIVRRKTGRKVERLADDRRFCHLLTARIGNAAHNSCDPDLAVGKSLHPKLSTVLPCTICSAFSALCLLRFALQQASRESHSHCHRKIWHPQVKQQRNAHALTICTTQGCKVSHAHGAFEVCSRCLSQADGTQQEKLQSRSGIKVLFKCRVRRFACPH